MENAGRTLTVDECRGSGPRRSPRQRHRQRAPHAVSCRWSFRSATDSQTRLGSEECSDGRTHLFTSCAAPIPQTREGRREPGGDLAYALQPLSRFFREPLQAGALTPI